MRPRRRLFLFAFVSGLVVACGLSALEGGIDLAPPGDAGRDAALPNTDAGLGDVVASDAPVDATLDVSQDNCLALCEAGTCDAGWCEIACVGTNACPTAAVVCPPGIPCHARCEGAGACTQGVDCSGASACKVDCMGQDTCRDAVVSCSGVTCEVGCIGQNACSQGVTCDAGSCNVVCEQASACRNGIVDCTSDDCAIRCGTGADDSRSACLSGVSCTAKAACSVQCTSRETCRTGPVTVRAGTNGTVGCLETSTCQGGVFVTAADASIACSGSNACNAQVHCDGGQCAATCTDVSDITFCCAAETCSTTETNCAITDGGC